MTINSTLIYRTGATVTNNNIVSRSYPETRNGLSDVYSIYGLNVVVETTRLRGWLVYETAIRVTFVDSIDSRNLGFDTWYKDYKHTFGKSFLNQDYSRNLVINTVSVEHPSQSKLTKAHEVGVLVGESFALLLINKYLELLFNAVDKEVIERQIAELNSRLSAIA